MIRKPRRGEWVLWYPHANLEAEPAPAVVTRVENSAWPVVVLTTFGAHSHPDPGKHNVRHISDPLLLQSHDVRTNYGGFDFMPTYLEECVLNMQAHWDGNLKKVLETVSELRGELESLKEALGEKKPVKK